ncbi:hypothetical protein E1189_10200, partial [Sansalvadorimonas verongulae]|nr:hypothetical protein [Sansalvadorimonas verongulae]
MGSIGSTGQSQTPPPVTDQTLSIKSKSGFARHDSVTSESDVVPLVASGQESDSSALKKEIGDRDVQKISHDGLPSLRQETPEALRTKKEAALKKADIALEKLGQLNLMDRALGVLNHEEGAEAREKDQIVISVTVPPSTEPVSVFPPDPKIDAEKMKELQAIAQKALSNFKQDPRNADFDREKLTAEVENVKVELTQIREALVEKGESENIDWEYDFKALENRDFSFNVEDGDGHQVITAAPRTAPVPKDESEEVPDSPTPQALPSSNPTPSDPEVPVSGPVPPPPPPPPPP